jgi:hypothetical protein
LNDLLDAALPSRRERTAHAAGLALKFKLKFNPQGSHHSTLISLQLRERRTQPQQIQVLASSAAFNARINRARRTAQTIQVDDKSRAIRAPVE